MNFVYTVFSEGYAQDLHSCKPLNTVNKRLKVFFPSGTAEWPYLNGESVKMLLFLAGSVLFSNLKHN